MTKTRNVWREMGFGWLPSVPWAEFDTSGEGHGGRAVGTPRSPWHCGQGYSCWGAGLEPRLSASAPLCTESPEPRCLQAWKLEGGQWSSKAAPPSRAAPPHPDAGRKCFLGPHSNSRHPGRLPSSCNVNKPSDDSGIDPHDSRRHSLLGPVNPVARAWV